MNKDKSKFTEKLGVFFKNKKTKKSLYSLAMTAICLAIVILANVLTGIAVEKNPSLQFDMTKTQTYQLQNDTVQYVRQIDRDVTIHVLETEKNLLKGYNAYSGADFIYQADKLLRKIAAENDHITLKFTDLSKSPSFGQKYSKLDWNGEGTDKLFIIIDAGNDSYKGITLGECFTISEEALSYYGYYVYTATTVEQAVVTGLLTTTNDELVGVDILTGSGENYYSGLKALLEKNAYSTNEVDIKTGKLSADSDIAIIYAPSVDLSKDEMKKVEKWLDSDSERGRTLIYIPDTVNTETPRIDALLEKYGMKVNDGVAFTRNTDSYISSYDVIVTDYTNTVYTESLRNPDIPVIVTGSRDIEVSDTSAASPLLSMKEKAGVVPVDAEINADSDFDEYIKSDGVNLAAIGTKKGSETTSNHVAVFGSAAMFAESMLADNTINNSNYIVNFCNTVTGRGDLGIVITSAQFNTEKLEGITQNTTNVMNIIFVWVLPIAILLAGLAVSIFRRVRSSKQSRGE